MHRPLIALVPAVALTCALAAFAALVPSRGYRLRPWLPKSVKGSVSSTMKPSAATAARAEPATPVMTARSALKKLGSAFSTTPPTLSFFMTASTIFSAARPASPPMPRS